MSILGILTSFKIKKIVYIDDNLNLVNHKLNERIIDNFFIAIDKGLKIRNLEGHFLDKDFFNECYLFEG